MAELTVSIIPLDPYFVPDRTAAAKAKASLRRYYDYADKAPVMELMPRPTFYFDDDHYCDRYVCPRCGKTVHAEEDDEETGESSWRNFLHAAGTAPDPMKHEVTTSCCNSVVALPELDFKSGTGNVTAAICSFRLTVVNVDDLLSTARLEGLGKTLGCELQQMPSLWT